MNIAFPAIVAFLLVIPGLIYLTVRPREPSRRLPSPPAPFSTEAVVVVISAAALHLFWYFVTWLALTMFHCDLRMRPASVLPLLSGHVSGSDNGYATAVASIGDYPVQVAAYFFGLYMVAFLVALRIGPSVDPRLITWGILPDRDARANEWRKFFKTDGGAITVITTVVDLGGEAYLFAGQLVELYFDPATQEIDRFALEDVWRRKLADDEPTDSIPVGPTPVVGGNTESDAQSDDSASPQPLDKRWHAVEGNLFLIHYSETRTVNIRYWSPAGD